MWKALAYNLFWSAYFTWLSLTDPFEWGVNWSKGVMWIAGAQFLLSFAILGDMAREKRERKLERICLNRHTRLAGEPLRYLGENNAD